MSEPRINENIKVNGKWTRRKDAITHPANAQEAIDAAEAIREKAAEWPESIRKEIGLACRVLDAWFDAHRPDRTS
jgi:hypothetical protein